MIDPYYEPCTELGFGIYKVKKAGLASKEAHHNLRKETTHSFIFMKQLEKDAR